ATYYAYLRLAIAAARDELGDELTRWRDAVGKEIGEGSRPEDEEGGARRGTGAFSSDACKPCS
ncbi:hypothetical protein C8J56DRAFT_938202, partial [Mycena floridula]